jgi:uncharacterized cysteine cluster protein YcgN (CxxCxxCC family)
MKPELLKNQPVLTDKAKERLNEIYGTLIYGATRQDLINKFKLDDRTIRDCINFIRKRYPVISSSAKAGYKLAINQEDLEDVHKTISETKSRIKELQASLKPLENFVETVITFEI